MAENDYAIVVGISRYPKLRDLTGPVQDAQDFYEWLKGNGRVPETNIICVLSEDPPKPGDRPIQDEIDAAFEGVFSQVRSLPGQQGRRLYFYFAGHGCSGTSADVTLLMANASLDMLNYSLNAQSYHECLVRKPFFQEQIIFYDCCRNYDRRARGREAPWSLEDPPAATSQVKQFILYAAAFTQYANEREIESERRGLFTKALLEGLKRAVDNKDGKWVVTTNTLVPFVTSRLKELAKDFGLEQKPSRGPGTAEELILAEVENPELFAITVQGPADGQEVIVKNKSLKEIKRENVVNGKVVFELAPSVYQFVVASDLQRGALCTVGPDQPLLVQI